MQAYLALRDTARLHVESGAMPLLAESIKPLAGRDGFQASSQVQTAFSSSGVDQDLADL